MTSPIGLFTAFIAGLASFISPCVLPIVPGYLSFISGVNVAQLKGEEAPTHVMRRIFIMSVVFVLGFSTVFVSLGAAATRDVKVISRVVDYGGLFFDDVLPGQELAQHDHRSFRPDGWIEAGRAWVRRGDLPARDGRPPAGAHPGSSRTDRGTPAEQV